MIFKNAIPDPIRPAVPPYNGDPTTRPLWSVMIPCYNSDHYLRLTLESVLQQDPGQSQMHIEVIDDCSTKGNPEEIVSEIGQGRVIYTRNKKNLGATKTFNQCVYKSLGKLVHILHTDDLVLPGFYKKYSDLYSRFPRATLIAGPSQVIDSMGNVTEEPRTFVQEDGSYEEFIWLQGRSNILCTPSIVIPRSFYEQNGGYNEALHHTADWEMYYRAGLGGDSIFSKQAFSQYRNHEENDTQKHVVSGSVVEEILYAGEYIYKLSPNPDKSQLKAIRKNAAECFRGLFINAIYQKNFRLCYKYFVSTLVTDPNPVHFMYWIKTMIIYPIKKIRRLTSD